MRELHGRPIPQQPIPAASRTAQDRRHDLILFELTEKLWMPAETDAPTPEDAGGLPNVPYSRNPKRVYRNVEDYQLETVATPLTLYMPAVPQDGAGDPTCLPFFAAGSRVWARYSEASNRWEIVEPCPNMLRFEIAAGQTLTPSSTGVSAFFIDDPDENALTIYCPPNRRYGYAKGGVGLTAGAQGTAVWTPQRDGLGTGRWEILEVEAEAVLTGLAAADIATAGSGNVVLDNGYGTVSASNLAWPQIFSGEAVTVLYRSRTDEYIIISATQVLRVREGGAMKQNPTRDLDLDATDFNAAANGDGYTADVETP